MTDFNELFRHAADFPDEAWGLYSFYRDFVEKRVPLKEKYNLILKAQDIGKEEAAKISGRFQTARPEHLAALMKLQIGWSDSPVNDRLAVFALFEPPDRILLSRTSVDAAAELLPDEDIESLLIAHEIFHFVEEEAEKPLFTRTFRVRTNRWLPFYSPVSCLSEIAAMSFAKNLCCIDWSPFALDIALLYHLKPEKAVETLEQLAVYMQELETLKRIK